ncbi:autophagy C terminal domain family protein [Schizosaccharomyces cryophilus OY26]|uniref:Autophagy C terminal domain family protein n=1 Tax=Schizosaccharomyces cryophilus (strain OY26 / ATCC MYA-4695 / CBS 11777 / NBRC 106824 / NRRL Y48691) TaxID=653667 RepID=S9VNV2_SCHCR|nr:autophagy C terminal domain family protein [Schizosaccharomyces cryophilus OY26]EPY49653.1 autophagy C terminal domain family protein [Schizosaccharomyces cryophilus OY26]
MTVSAISFQQHLLQLIPTFTNRGILCELVEVFEPILQLQWQAKPYSDEKTSFEEDESEMIYVLPDVSVQAWIRFSPSFQVPQFFFQLYSNGCFPLTKLENVTALLRPENRELAMDALAIGDCPASNGIAWYVHPCCTQTFFQTAQVSKQDTSYLPMWILYIHRLLSPITTPMIEALDDKSS